MSSLLEKMKSAGSIKHAEVMSKSAFFGDKEFVQTSVPIINVAFSGALDGGIVPGLSVIAGESKSFKTLLCLYAMKAYLTKYEDAVALVYDSEFGITPQYLSAQGIDTNRVLHIPIEHIEQLKFDMVKRLDEIKRGDRVFIMVDSLGNLASKKEVDDANEEKAVADMSRAKAIRSFFRIITPHLTMKNLPCLVINHIYKTMELYAKNVLGGGTAVMYSANTAFIITRAQEKDDGELSGYTFTINIEKSRFVKEKSKLPFTVSFENGINKWSGLLDIALDGGFVKKPSNGWYSRVDLETGEIEDKKWRAKDTDSKDFWLPLLSSSRFPEYVKQKYQLAQGEMIQFDETEVD